LLLQIKITASWRTAPSQQGRNNTPVSGTDFYPTLLELAGIPLKPQEHTDGQSLVPLLKEKKTAQRPLIWHYPHYGNQGGEPSSIIRLGDWKLIHYYEDGRNIPGKRPGIRSGKRKRISAKSNQPAPSSTRKAEA